MVILLLVSARVDASTNCEIDSIDKIEIWSSRGIFTPLRLSRSLWIKTMWRNPGSKEIVVMDQDSISTIMSEFCKAEKTQSLAYNVYDAAEKVINLRQMTAYQPITPEINGLMIIYYKNKSPEIIWLYHNEFDRNTARYKIPENFWIKYLKQ